MSDPSSQASKSLARLQKCINALVESGGSGSEETWMLNGAREGLKIAFQHDKIGSLTAVLDHLSEFTLEKVSLPKFYMVGKEKEEMRRELTHLVRSNIIDCLKESLEKESDGELQKLAKSIEGRDFLDEDKFQVSNASHVDSFVSCLQIAVSVRGTLSLKLLALVNKRILPDFHKLPEKRKLDILRGFAEISPFTPTLLAKEIRLSVTALLKTYIPSKKKKKFDEVKSSTHLECLLYIFHHVAHKAAKVRLGKILKERLERLKNITKERIEELAQTLCDDNAFIRKFENQTPKAGEYSRAGLEKFFSGRRRHNTKAEIRTCINLLAMIDELQSESISFMGDNSVKLSWKEAKEPVLGEAYRADTWTAPSRPALLASLPENLMESLRFIGSCYPDDETVKALIGTSTFQQVQQNRDSLLVLNDSGGVAMLCWQIKEEFSEFRDKDIGKKGSTGGVRDQLFHILCWAYASSDLSRGKLEPHALNENSPFCTWYLCAFCFPELIGSEPRSDKKGEKHHCYGTTIETGLLHIQNYGVPREYCTVFSCTDHEPPSAEEPRMCKRKITGVRRISTLKEALEELKNQAVGADLIDYTGMYFPGKRVYYGPYTPKFRSNFHTYHAVIMESLEIVDGELCVACKMSNGEDVGDGGYVYVSLRTVYMPLGAIKEQRKHVRISSEPMHLLTNFVVPEIDKVVEEKKEEEKKDEEEEDEEEEDEEEEEEEEKEEEEEEEYVPVAKRQRTPASNIRRFKDVTVEQEGSLLLEMQQRAIVNNPIGDWHTDIRSSLVERMPVLDEATFNVRRAGSLPASVSTKAKHSVSIPNGVAAAPRVDLLDLVSDDILAALSNLSGADFLQDLLGVDLGSSSAQFGATPAPKAGTDLLLDILSIGTPSPAQNRTSSIDLLSTADVNSNSSTALDTLSSSAPPQIATTAPTTGQAVQRHRVTILECVKDPDASIRKRALELVSLLVNENNVKQLTKELIDYLEISDEDFKEDLSAKICSILEKFSPEKIWYIDQMLKVLSEAGKFVIDGVWHALIVVISNASELHGYTVRALYKAVLTYAEQETLVRVAIWCIGEYGDLLVNNVGMLGIEDPVTVTECDAVDVVEDAITRHNSDVTTKAMALVALLKLSSRFPTISERIKDIIVKQKGNLLLEMQQSAIEFNSIVDRHKSIRSSLVERMSVLNEATFNVRNARSLPASVSKIAKPSVSIPNGGTQLH